MDTMTAIASTLGIRPGGQHGLDTPGSAQHLARSLWGAAYLHSPPTDLESSLSKIVAGIVHYTGDKLTAEFLLMNREKLRFVVNGDNVKIDSGGSER